jgi:hypothetical protein
MAYVVSLLTLRSRLQKLLAAIFALVAQLALAKPTELERTALSSLRTIVI